MEKQKVIEHDNTTEMNDFIKNDEQVKLDKQRISQEYPSSVMETFWLLTKFMLPLVVTQMVTDVGEQVLNRGITSIADDDMVHLLASFGLAYYVTRFISGPAVELRHVGIVLMTSTKANYSMSIFSFAVGLSLTLLQLGIGLTPAGMWLMRNLHQQPEDVSRLSCLLMAYLAPLSLLEAIACYYEGGLISQKLTSLAGMAKFFDFGLQVLFIIIQLFTPARTEPVIVPLFAIYAGIIGRLILCVGFWLIYVRRKLPLHQPTQKPVTLLTALKFWIPLAMVMLVQMVTRPAINLVVSRNIADSSSKEEAAKAVAVLTAVYPVGRFIWSWLNDLRAVIPAFHKTTPQHKKLSHKALATYTVFCTLTTFFLQAILWIIPGPGFYIMNTIVGLTPELSTLSIVPLKIFTGICFSVGVRAYLMGILIERKKTKYMTPAAIARLIAVVVLLATLPYIGLNGAVLGVTCLLLSHKAEALLLVITIIYLKYRKNCTNMKSNPSV